MDRSNYNRGRGGAARVRGDGGSTDRSGRGGGRGPQHRDGGGRPGGWGRGGGRAPTHNQSRAPQQLGYRPVQPRDGPHAGQNAGPVRPDHRSTRLSQSAPESPVLLPDFQTLKISERLLPFPPESPENRVLPMKRPDRGGILRAKPVRLLVNHFPLTFNPETIIWHYDVDIKPVMSPKSRAMKKPLPKSDLHLIRDKLFSDYPDRFPMGMTAYDGEKNIFSAVLLPTGQFKVDLSDGEDTKGRSYIFTIKLVNELKLFKLQEYLSGNLLRIPRDILQGMDLVMKEHPSRHRISVGRSTYSAEYRREDDLRYGIAAFRGFQQSIKPTSQGLALCLDYTVLAFRKRLPVIDFLKEHVRGFKGLNDLKRLRRQVTNALDGLKVTVTHRMTKQKYTIAGLTSKNTLDLSFILEDREGKDPPREVGLVEFFREKYGKEIMFKDIPCLDLGKGKRKNYVPMEFCILVEGQRYPKEQLDKNAGLLLKKISLAPPRERKNSICEMLQAEDGPCGGEVTQNFEIEVDQNMTSVVGRVLGPPDLKLGKMNRIRVDDEKRQWNLFGKSVVEGRPIERWAFIDFSSYDHYNKLNPDYFINNLIIRCRNLGIRMEGPLVCRFTNMHAFSNVNSLHCLLQDVIDEASRKSEGKLQIIVCVMAGKHDGYKSLKWVSETQIGVLTQCCLSSHANIGNDQYFANLALKINAKLGGSNAELIEPLPRFEGPDHVMFVGADVNHPSPRNRTCPSIAAVVATVNWPAANRYAARVCPQDHRRERIMNFGAMVRDLVDTYARVNKVKPKSIVVFRDGVSEGQFDMVLNEELVDLKRAIYEEHYRPKITLVVAQKRHQTRLFLGNERDGGRSGNVPPGTVVDTTIVHPFEFDFYLCSHYGTLGTSKPTHYYVLWDEHCFTSDQLQKLIYNMCFTFARCTKPVSLVPPVYYADLVAYRGRMFQEVVMEFQSPASASSSSSCTSSSSSSTASFDDRFYKLHSELQNVMFFV